MTLVLEEPMRDEFGDVLVRVDEVQPDLVRSETNDGVLDLFIRQRILGQLVEIGLDRRGSADQVAQQQEVVAPGRRKQADQEHRQRSSAANRGSSRTASPWFHVCVPEAATERKVESNSRRRCHVD